MTLTISLEIREIRKEDGILREVNADREYREYARIMAGRLK